MRIISNRVQAIAWSARTRPSFVKQTDVGVLVCEALRARSAQRANKYPAAVCAPKSS